MRDGGEVSKEVIRIEATRRCATAVDVWRFMYFEVKMVTKRVAGVADRADGRAA